MDNYTRAIDKDGKSIRDMIEGALNKRGKVSSEFKVADMFSDGNEIYVTVNGKRYIITVEQEV